MKTRDEFIAETAREYDIHGRLGPSGNPVCCGGREAAICLANAFADELERLGVVPWGPPLVTDEKSVVQLLAAAKTWTDRPSIANRRDLLAAASVCADHLAAKAEGG